nr:hypothetical protein [Clostridia bacterium]
MTDEEKKMVSTVLSDFAKKENMTVEEFVAEVLPAFRANYENAKEDHKEFWEGFTPAGGSRRWTRSSFGWRRS